MKLLVCWQVHPPDLQQRAYYQSLGLKTSDADVGEASTGKMLNTPPPPRSSIFTTDTSSPTRKGPSLTDAHQTPGFPASQSNVSLVAPLLWVPGVLRAQVSVSPSYHSDTLLRVCFRGSDPTHPSP